MWTAARNISRIGDPAGYKTKVAYGRFPGKETTISQSAELIHEVALPIHIMGLGLALMEETLFDERSGRVMNPSLSEYYVPVHMDVSGIDVIWTDIPDPHTPMGTRGTGATGNTGTEPAVANAIHNATGNGFATCRLPSTSCSEIPAPPGDGGL